MLPLVKEIEEPKEKVLVLAVPVPITWAEYDPSCVRRLLPPSTVQTDAT
jgi:hypothetical protein